MGFPLAVELRGGECKPDSTNCGMLHSMEKVVEETRGREVHIIMISWHVVSIHSIDCWERSENLGPRQTNLKVELQLVIKGKVLLDSWI